MKYGKIAAFESISCWCDRFISAQTDGDYCQFLSLFGREAEVTSVMGSFIEKRECRVEDGNGKTYWLYRDKSDTYRILTRKTGNVLHKIAFGMEAFQGDRSRIIIADSFEEVKSKAMRFLDSAVSVPINMAWQDQVFWWMQEDANLRCMNLSGFEENTIAYEVNLPSEEELEDFILNQVLPAVNQ